MLPSVVPSVDPSGDPRSILSYLPSVNPSRDPSEQHVKSLQEERREKFEQSKGPGIYH